MDPRHDPNGFQMPSMTAPPLMNPPPQIFGAYDGLPNMNMADLSAGQLFGDGALMDDSIEAKRRRIARVCDAMRRGGEGCCADDDRRVICVGRRRSSAMGRCLLARIVSIIRRNVSSLRWRRREILRKGMAIDLRIVCVTC